jgi:phosphoserine phosphatase
VFIATLVAKDRLSAGDISAVCDALGGTAGPMIDGIACDVRFDLPEPNGEASLLGPLAPAGVLTGMDIIVQPLADRHRKLLIADMDSTMITVECIDELADYVGLKAEVSEVTERAMRGELDFAEALRSRVALLAGLSEATVAECLRARVKLMGGAVDLITAFKTAGGRAVLVSGGFTHFTDSVAKQIGFDRAVANRLIVKDGALTGEVEFPIVDAQTKRETLIAEAAALGIPLSTTIAIGDGANDIPMIEAAGLGVAYHAKPKTEAAADACVRFGDLNVVRYALGLNRPV